MRRASVENSSRLRELAALVRRGRVLVLTGAGVSTDSGIPDYRDEHGAWKQRKPMEYREFTGSFAARRRYWARSFAGFQRLAHAAPNVAHRAITGLEQRGLVSLLVTQNVDGLHQASGARNVVDLHGRIDRVVCLGCRALSPRAELQAELARLNPRFGAEPAQYRPDGDAELADADVLGFELADCAGCGGVLKPDVVFFGENVPAERVERAMQAVLEAESLLVVGSSLMVFSGYRFARAAARRGIPIAIVNRGTTRADGVASLKLDAGAGDVLSRLLGEL